MQSVKPLRLKRETYRSASKADSHLVVNVWVDSGLSHLDGVYSYRCPNELIEKVSIGSRLKVPFNSRSCEALVVEIIENSEAIDHYKVIESVLGNVPVANTAMIEFYRAMAKYWASDPYSLIKFGIPSRVASVERVTGAEPLKYSKNINVSKKTSQNYFMMHSPHKSAYLEIVELALERMIM
jgi:primosomal protein N'